MRFTTVDVVPGITLALLDLCQPLSTGSVSINSPDPLSPPVIDLGGYPIQATSISLYPHSQNYIVAINAQLQAIDPSYQMVFPDPAILNDTAALTAFIKEEIDPNMHFQSHCRMGSVVDSTGRVFGVNNLFVADNSINPFGTDGSPYATALLNAENIAELLGH